MNIGLPTYDRIAEGFLGGLPPWAEHEREIVSVERVLALVDENVGQVASMKFWLDVVAETIPFGMLAHTGIALLEEVSHVNYIVANGDAFAGGPISKLTERLVNAQNQLRGGTETLRALCENAAGAYSKAYEVTGDTRRQMLGPLFALPWVLLTPNEADEARKLVLQQVCTRWKSYGLGPVGYDQGVFGRFMLRPTIGEGSLSINSGFIASNGLHMNAYLEPALANHAGPKEIWLSADGFEPVRLSTRVVGFDPVMRYLELTPFMSRLEIEEAFKRLAITGEQPI